MEINISWGFIFFVIAVLYFILSEYLKSISNKIKYDDDTAWNKFFIMRKKYYLRLTAAIIFILTQMHASKFEDYSYDAITIIGSIIAVAIFLFSVNIKEKSN